MQVCARRCLEQRVVGGVHDGEPVLAESSAVCPSEVTHELRNEKQKKKRIIKNHCSEKDVIMCWPSLLPYLDGVLHVFLAGLLLHHL